jgi:hypothetical protein
LVPAAGGGQATENSGSAAAAWVADEQGVFFGYGKLSVVARTVCFIRPRTVPTWAIST